MPHGKHTKTCYHKKNIPTNQQQCPLNNEVKNDFYICMELMIICTLQKQKIKVSHENVIGKTKLFHWKPMHNEQL